MTITDCHLPSSHGCGKCDTCRNANATRWLRQAHDELRDYEAEIRLAVTYIGALGCGGYHENCDPCEFVRRHSNS